MEPFEVVDTDVEDVTDWRLRSGRTPREAFETYRHEWAKLYDT